MNLSNQLNDHLQFILTESNLLCGHFVVMFNHTQQGRGTARCKLVNRDAARRVVSGVTVWHLSTSPDTHPEMTNSPRQSSTVRFFNSVVLFFVEN